MPLVSMRQLLDHAAEHGYGLPAFNVNNLEQVQAIMAAETETDSPVIMQASAGARKYAGEHFLRHLIEAAVESYPSVPVVMHQDHGQSPEVCRSAMGLGSTSVMMDGSLQADGKTIASYDYNLDVTRKVVDMAHAIGVTVEGELGLRGGGEKLSVAAGWATPNCMDHLPSGNLENRKEKGGRANLKDQVPMTAGWVTPQSRDSKGVSQNYHREDKPKDDCLPDMVFGQMQSGTPAETGNCAGYLLNPHFSRWLQGYPAEWLCSKFLATLSVPRSQRNLSRRQRKH